jgi:hypothetical protein
MEQNDVIRKQMKYTEKQLSQKIRKLPRGTKQLPQGEMIFSQKEGPSFSKRMARSQGTMSFHLRKIQVAFKKYMF